MKKPTAVNLALDTAHYTPEIIAMLDGTKTCLRCGKRLKYTGKDPSRNRGYCCEAHYFAYPPKMAYIAHVHGRPARDVIVELLNRTDNKNATAELLGIGKQLLFSYMRKLGIRETVRYE